MEEESMKKLKGGKVTIMHLSAYDVTKATMRKNSIYPASRAGVYSKLDKATKKRDRADRKSVV